MNIPMRHELHTVIEHLKNEARKDRECGWPKKAEKKEQAAELLRRTAVPAEFPAIHLTRSSGGTTSVAVDVGGRWVNVITEHGDIISHIVEPLGIRKRIEQALGKDANGVNAPLTIKLWSYEWQDENGGWNTVWKPHTLDYCEDKGHRNLRCWDAATTDGVAPTRDVLDRCERCRWTGKLCEDTCAVQTCGEPKCDGCGGTIAQHTPMLNCRCDQTRYCEQWPNCNPPCHIGARADGVSVPGPEVPATADPHEPDNDAK